MKFLKTFIILLLFIFLDSCQEANINPWFPPTPKPSEKDTVWGDYFPNSPGTQWTYHIKIKTTPDGEIDGGNVTVSILERVLIKDSVSVSLWSFNENGNVTQNYVAIVKDSVFFFTDIDNTIDPKTIIKNYILPLNVFREWNVRILDQTFGKDNSSGGGEFIDPITVAAGTFNNVYEIERITDAQDRKAFEWIDFVPQVGLIRKETLNNNTNETTIWELTDFKFP